LKARITWSTISLPEPEEDGKEVRRRDNERALSAPRRDPRARVPSPTGWWAVTVGGGVGPVG
jgi:hypothetical protein